MSLRDKDYELAVKLGVIDEDTKNKRQYVKENYQYDYEDDRYELEIAKLKDTIICLSKELLKKEETIKRLEEDFAKSRRDEKSMYSYYEELKTTFDEIAPKKAFRKQPSTKLHRTRRTAWSTAAAVVLCLLSFVLGWNHLFSSTARAGQSTAFSLSDGMMCVQNVGSFKMVAYVRTTPKENFAYFDSKADLY